LLLQAGWRQKRLAGTLAIAVADWSGEGSVAQLQMRTIRIVAATLRRIEAIY
jgi:hypothetical protein